MEIPESLPTASMLNQNRKVMAGMHRLMEYNGWSWTAAMEYFEQLRRARTGPAAEWATFEADLILSTSLRFANRPRVKGVATTVAGNGGSVSSKGPRFSISPTTAKEIKDKNLCLMFNLGRCTRPDKHLAMHSNQSVTVDHKCHKCGSSKHGLAEH